MPDKPSEKGKAVDKLPDGTNPQDGEVHIQLPTEEAEEVDPIRFESIDDKADKIEQYFLEGFRNGAIPEEELRQTLDYFRAGRTRPSKIREIDIVEARLEIARSLREAKGGAGETTKKAKNKRSRQKG